MSLPELVLLVNVAATWFMCGVIGFVQLVHYPLFRDYAREGFRTAMLAHQKRTGWVVAPAMLAELLTALLLLAFPPPGVPGWMPWAGAALAGVWAVSTAWVQIPLHEKLTAGGFDEETHRQLVTSNWVRTVAWSARGVLCGVMLGNR